ncbi:Biotin synthase-related enzyme [Methanosarcina horonobensis HB-1 = JCM 15518]|uniref:Biotin synthase-related enzyme n=1 Tax=Methanosarcina horonobensis HB-1 = JCM 15518 TaxID=1434110 RepID=A0A0E3SDT5_9EURY|nr:radical SAM protein [Methanosarcina horonobensis]AKB80244.1 Biotin synthase-related enzyme [Methanosarcina horonobensis HB-1 = JCM 15518]
MQSTQITPEIKAFLISIGSVSVDPLLIPRARGSTAGPGAGTSSVFFRAGGKRVRLSVNKNSPLSIAAAGDSETVALLHEGKELARGKLEPAPAHCPDQAFITLCERCIFDCKYCPVPKLQGHVKSEEEVLSIVDDVLQAGSLKAISITSGVETSIEGEVERVLSLLPALQKYDVPIGVSVYPTRGCSRKFYDSGVAEVKYNVETMDREIFRKVCGDLSLDYILDRLKEAVEIFGKNRVFSNFIIGLGETDDSVREGIETLAKIGVIPILRPVNPHPLRSGDCFTERPSPERLLKLAKMEAEILKKYGLDPSLAMTMCLKCTGCDLVPAVDF